MGEGVVGEDVELMVLFSLGLAAFNNDEWNGFCRDDTEHKKHIRCFAHAREDIFIKFKGLCHRIFHAV